MRSEQVSSVSEEVSLVAPGGDKGVTQTDIETNIRTPNQRGPETEPPMGVTEDRWHLARSILAAALGRLDSDERNERLVDWASFRAKSQFCFYLECLVDHGFQQRAIVDELTEGGYGQVTYPARAMFKRLQSHVRRILPNADQLEASTSAKEVRVDFAAIMNELVLAGAKPTV